MFNYPDLLNAVKERIRKAQTRAVISANAELLMLYWDIGSMVAQRQHEEGWGASIIPRLARDIKNEMSEVKGFSERNIGRMLNFYKEYSAIQEYFWGISAVASDEAAILPPAVAKLADTGEDLEKKLISYVFRLPWAHNVILLSIKDKNERLWYMVKDVEAGWSRDCLAAKIKSNTYGRQGHAITNFADRLPAPNSVLAQEALKDPYIFDFLTLEEPFHEREMETALVTNVEKFLLELGKGFAFMGRQYHLAVGDEDFYIDLLFYHTRLHCYVVIELKKGAFKPEYAGKVNFYCSVVDDYLKQEKDQPTIGLILCQTKNRFVAEYALRGTQKPIGVSEYELTKYLPENLKSLLPSIDSIEERMDELTKGTK